MKKDETTSQNDTYDAPLVRPQTTESRSRPSRDETGNDERILCHPLFNESIIHTPQATSAYRACKEIMHHRFDGATVIGTRAVGRREMGSVESGFRLQNFLRTCSGIRFFILQNK